MGILPLAQDGAQVGWFIGQFDDCFTRLACSVTRLDVVVHWQGDVPHCSPLPFPPPHAKKNMKNYYYPARKLSLIQDTPKHMVGISSYGIIIKKCWFYSNRAFELVFLFHHTNYLKSYKEVTTRLKYTLFWNKLWHSTHSFCHNFARVSKPWEKAMLASEAWQQNTRETKKNKSKAWEL
jgi:hypothetical protein